MELLAEARERAATFAERHRGQVAELDAAGLADAMRELRRSPTWPGGRAPTRCSTSRSTRRPARRRPDPAGARARRGDRDAAAVLRARVERSCRDERAEELLAADGLDFCRHHLRTLRRYRPHQLTEPEERVHTELDVTGASAFRRLFTEQISAIDGRACPDAAEPVPLEEALSRLQDPDRERARAGGRRPSPRRCGPGCAPAPSCSTRCSPTRRPRTGCAPTRHWLASRNLANEASDESVEALVEAVRRPLRAGAALVPAQGAAARARPARLLRPHGAGERRPTSASPTTRRASWCSTATRSFSPELGEVAGRVLRRAATSTRRRGPASAAARSAPTRSPRRTPT